VKTKFDAILRLERKYHRHALERYILILYKHPPPGFRQFIAVG
jgi:hypothetical protein